MTRTRNPIPAALLAVLLAALLAAAGCSDEGSNPADPGDGDTPGPTVSFAADIQPIFDQNCVGCHGADGNAGLNLSAGASRANLVDVMSTETAMNRVTAGDPAQSWLYQKLTGAQGNVGSVMPPSGALPATTTDKVRTWIEEGALDN